jgi:hypothetical protein
LSLTLISNFKIFYFLFFFTKFEFQLINKIVLKNVSQKKKCIGMGPVESLVSRNDLKVNVPDGNHGDDTLNKSSNTIIIN